MRNDTLASIKCEHSKFGIQIDLNDLSTFSAAYKRNDTLASIECAVETLLPTEDEEDHPLEADFALSLRPVRPTLGIFQLQMGGMCR